MLLYPWFRGKQGSSCPVNKANGPGDGLLLARVLMAGRKVAATVSHACNVLGLRYPTINNNRCTAGKPEMVVKRQNELSASSASLHISKVSYNLHVHIIQSYITLKTAVPQELTDSESTRKIRLLVWSTWSDGQQFSVFPLGVCLHECELCELSHCHFSA